MRGIRKAEIQELLRVSVCKDQNQGIRRRMKWALPPPVSAGRVANAD